MENLNKIINYLNNYLKVEEIDDVSWNGLQIEGTKEVKKIAFCVTAGGEVFKKILQENPDLIIVHHGIYWKGANPSAKGWMMKRVKSLIKTDTSLYGCHLPLDRHKEIGHNAQILKLIGSKPKEELAIYKGKNIGWVGELNSTSIKNVFKKMEDSLEDDCKLLNYGKQKISKVGVVSGSGGKYIYEAINKNLDLLITGEEMDIAEVAKDAKINVIFGGHYGTETLGVKALKEKIKEKFDVKTNYFSFPTTL